MGRRDLLRHPARGLGGAAERGGGGAAGEEDAEDEGRPAAEGDREVNGRHSEGERLYNRLARGYDLLAHPRRIRAEVDALEPHLRAIGAERVLDAGCGAGHHLRELVRRGIRADGIDRSDGMIREARRRTKEEGLRARFRVHDLTGSAPVPGGPYDAVLCLGNTAASFHTERERLRAL
ncbi:MAG: methyltransferase domain-containing protein, partial [Candidatus Eisenbacteria bacterium]|nr:methyltransferase domain-containing protein [Candidatus Latescibacterota bacterium]MBD3303013.1 methyltransferase domain-containing protein [Candidatus Eisenbacteria bacterium]